MRCKYYKECEIKIYRVIDKIKEEGFVDWDRVLKKRLRRLIK